MLLAPDALALVPRVAVLQGTLGVGGGHGGSWSPLHVYLGLSYATQAEDSIQKGSPLLGPSYSYASTRSKSGLAIHSQ